MFVSLTARPRLLVATAALVTVGALACHPTLAQSLGADVWNVPTYEEQLRESQNHSAELDAEDGDIRRRIALKEALVAELIAGRATLDDVTARFLELNSTRPQYMDSIRLTFPGATDRESTARNVISYALARVPDDARDALVAKLNSELDHLTAHSPAR